MAMVDILTLLNLPILGGIIIIIFKAGRIAQTIEEHDRRLGALERRARSR